MEISVSFYTAQGKRPTNQDAVSLMENGHATLAVVADGLGGHQAGELASKQAISTINRLLQSSVPNKSEVIDAIQQANCDINALQKESQTLRTTVAVLWIHGGMAIAANVGDTRIYQFRSGKIIYQSIDHSVAQMAVLIGEIKPEDIRKSADKNKLIRVLGDRVVPKVDTQMLSVQSGDRFLLCSDGFWEYVTEHDMIAAANTNASAQTWLEIMRQKVDDFSCESQDNHSAIALIIN